MAEERQAAAVTVRRAEARDMAAIENLLTQVNRIHHEGRPDIFNLGVKYEPEQLRGILADDARPVFVAEHPEKGVLGYCFGVFEQIVGDTIRTPIRTLYIDDLCVDEQARGMHIGRTLYDAVCAFARESGCYNVTLNVWTLNPTAQKFYEAVGMKPLKTCMEHIL